MYVDIYPSTDKKQPLLSQVGLQYPLLYITSSSITWHPASVVVVSWCVSGGPLFPTRIDNITSSSIIWHLVCTHTYICAYLQARVSIIYGQETTLDASGGVALAGDAGVFVAVC